MPDKNRTATSGPAHSRRQAPRHSPHSTWLAVSMILPGLALIAAVAWASGRVLPWFAAAVNVTAFLLYWHDKAAARKDTGRVPELVLHLCALAGGTPAALLAGRLFHHKTRKWKFQAVYWPTVVAHLALAAWGASMMLSARGYDGRTWAAIGCGVLAAINLATFMLEPMRSRSRAGTVALVLIVLGGGLGAALRSQVSRSTAWAPYLAGTAQLGLALWPAMQAVRSLWA